MAPDDVTKLVKDAGLRGRGGAGFSAGLKWSFLPKNHPGPIYLCVNADESEPGTFNNRILMEQDPHQLLEGIAIACHAIRSHTAYIYLRYEYGRSYRVLDAAIKECYAAGLLGKNILGSGFKLDVYLHRGAGAYICGEETGLIESLEGKRAWPRIKPPFPGDRRPVPQADDRQQRRDAVLRDAHPAARRRLVQIDRRAARSEQPARPGQLRAEAVLHQRAREQAGLRRVAAGRDGPRADRRAWRRRVEGPQGEGGGAGRHQHGLPVGRRARYAARFRRAGQSRLPGLGHGGGRRGRRPDEHGRRALQLLPVHVARIVRPVYAVPRRHELDDEDSGAHPQRARASWKTSICCSKSPTRWASSRARRFAACRTARPGR